MVDPSEGGFPFCSYLVGGDVPVGLDLDDPVRAIGLDDDEVRVVLPAVASPEDGKLAGVQPNPAGHIG